MRAPADSMKPTTGTRARSASSQHAHDGVGVRLAERPAGERRVLREAEDRAAVDRARRAEDAVAVAGLLAHPARAHLGAHQLQRAGVAEHLQPLERAEALVGALDEGEGHAASSTSTALWPPKPNEFETPTAGRPSGTSSGRERPGT